jgi:prephenate dehydrogenase
MVTQHIGIVGYGRFGKALGTLVEQAGRSFRAWDPSAPVPPEANGVASLADLLSLVDTVFISVPVAQFRDALEAMVPWVRPEHTLLDVGSVKMGPEESFRSVVGARCAWVATHPLFGPVSLSRGERPLRVVVCPNETHPDAVEYTRTLYESLGCEVRLQDADAHDRLMAETHALTFLIAKALLDMNVGEGTDFVPPSFAAMSRAIDSVRGDAGHLFLAIQRENPHAQMVRRQFIDALENLDDLVLASEMPESNAGGLSIVSGSKEVSEELAAVRDHIDDLDRELLALLTRRSELSRRAALAKAKRGQVVWDPDREVSLLADRMRWAEGVGLDSSGVREIFESVLRLSRKVQREGQEPKA